MKNLSKLAKKHLPEDGFAGLLLTRVWHTDSSGISGPSPALIKDHNVMNLSPFGSTIAELLNNDELLSICQKDDLEIIADFESIIENTLSTQPNENKAKFLTPVDIQAIKACGVTFVCSMLERVIEEKAAGDVNKAAEVRAKINANLDIDLSKIVPGSEAAEKLKQALIAENMWSQYLEVGIGPYAEVFSKSQPLSSMGLGDEVGINRISTWNNPEPEVVLLVNNQGHILGAALGNDVNLRDVEGRSALLLGKAKDNNASCSIGPFIRLFDDTFSIDDVRNMHVNLEIAGKDGFFMNDHSDMGQISRDVTDLVSQTINPSHQYPDGLALFTGTLFAPTIDRDVVGQGFTHKIGDVVRIRSSKLGCLENTVNYSDAISPWIFGFSALMQNLKARELL